MVSNKVIIMKLFVGIDVSKNTLDVYWNGNEINVLNHKKGFRKLSLLFCKERKKGNEISLVICEATGGYEAQLAKFMLASNIPMHIAHANKIRSFAKSTGLLAKTDRIDARLIAQYGELMRLEANQRPRAPEEELLGELLKRRDQLLADKIRESNRLDKPQSPELTKSRKAHVKWLETEIDNIENEIKKLKENKELNEKIELLKSVPAVGDVTANSLVAFLPELGAQDDKQIVALVGLAPFNKDSGKYRGKRCIQGGRAQVRKVLYMAALSATRYYKEMRIFYLSLRARGKMPKVALIAVARKLLLVLNSVMKRETKWVNKDLACNNA